MNVIIRAAIVYLFLLVIFRLAGRRTLKEVTTFDLILLLIISEAIQGALVGQDYSLTNSLLLVVTLVGIDIGLSLIKQRSKPIARALDGIPILLIENGKMHEDRMQKERVDEQDIIVQARKLRGLERLDQIKYAILENEGDITIIPYEQTQK